MKILLALLLFTTPVLAEDVELEMFEEICEVTGEVKKGFRLREIRLQISPQVSSLSPSEQQSTF